jgi:hypothetical protein
MIAESNVSKAWARAFQHAFANPHEAGPMAVSFRLPASGEVEEDATLRRAVDLALKAAKKVSVQENAAMLFPLRTWQCSKAQGRAAFYEHYKTDVFPRIKARVKGKFYGTYFERMIGFGDGSKNQLEHIIEFWERRAKKKLRPRPSALLAACFDPQRDHTFEPLRGFPCLQQVSFAYDRTGKGLAVSAYYPCQYVFDRGYGNYLGLAHLGKFVADALKLNLLRVNCFVAAPLLSGSVTKTSLAPLVRAVERALATVPVAA